MLHQILLPLVGTVFVFIAGLIVYTAIACRLARWRFEKACMGLPMAKEQRILGNGAVMWGMRKNLCTEVVAVMQRYQSKTVAWLYGTKPFAVTYDLDLIKKILDEPNKHINRTDTLNLPLPEFENSIMLALDDRWHRIRRSFAPAVKGKRLKAPNVLSEIECSIEKLIGLIESKLADKTKLTRDKGRLVNMDDIAHRYTLDLALSCLYKQPELVNFDERPCRWTELVDNGFTGLQSNVFVHASIVFPILKPVIVWLVRYLHPQGVWRRELLQFIKRQARLAVEARKQLQELVAAGERVDPDNFTLKDGTKFRRNMIDYVIDQVLDGKLARDDFFNTSFFLLNASSKTSSDAITHMIYRLAVNPEIQERLRKSVQDHGIESEYLSWVINESLRLRPPASIGCSRSVAHDIEVEGGPQIVPKGTFVVMPAYVIHRLPEYWGEHADEFRPERWRNTSHHHPQQFIPFGHGPRGCLGKEFALFSLKNVTAALMTRYKFEAEVKQDSEVFDSPLLLTIVPNSPTMITVKRL